MVYTNSIVCGIKGCQRRFKTKYNVEKHRELHGFEAKYECKECGKRYIEMSALSQHKRRHSNRRSSSSVNRDYTPCDTKFSKVCLNTDTEGTGKGTRKLNKLIIQEDITFDEFVLYFVLP